MKAPRVVVLEADGWIARQLRELAGESRWLVRSVRSSDAAWAHVRAGGPIVLLVQFEPLEDRPGPLELLAEVHRLRPTMPVVAVADTKLPDADRAAWTAALFDLGARYVLFPPLTKVVLEDVVSGLMMATVRREVGAEAAGPRLVAPTPPPEVIDLAREEP